MIDWEDTLKTYGYDQSSFPMNNLRRAKRMVVCLCDTCKKRKEVRIRDKGNIVDGQRAWLCPSCVNLGRSDEISQQLTKQWQTAEYQTARSASSKQLWMKTGYREKHSIATRLGMTKVDMSVCLRARYADPQARQKLRDISKALFNNEAFRLRHAAKMNSDEVRRAISVEAKARWTHIWYREKMAEIRSQQQVRVSGIQTMLYRILDDLGVEYHCEGVNTKIGWYMFDCLIVTKDQKILVECQGDYWHSSKNAQMRDKQKFTYVSRYFPEYKIVYLWEREFYQDNKISSKIKALLNIEQPHVDFEFSDINVRKLSNNESSKDFLDLYHYLGPGRGGIRFAAFHNDVMIAVAIFSTKLRQNSLFSDESLECSRFCIHPNYHKKNFGSWLLNRCSKALRGTQLYAFSDSTVGHDGTIYRAAGWRINHTIPPDYWYVDAEGYVMHKKTLYNRASNLKMTESEFANKYGYSKVYGGPKTCFVLENK